ncbi:MAG: AMP-binding protein [Chloroflexi bacterium]|nr:AMP-binding protein [Chloroflexota bacterium]
MPYPEFTLHHMLLNSVERNPQKTVIVSDGRSYSYGELYVQAASLARALKEQGLRRGDRVGIYLEKSWEAAVSIFGVIHAGGVFVNIGPLLKERQVSHILSNCRARMLIADPPKVEGYSLPPIETAFFTGEDAPSPSWAQESIRFDDAISNMRPGCIEFAATERDLATIIYTSGSTGLPKGIMLTHHNQVAGTQIVSTYVQNTPDDRVLVVLPINLDYGLNQINTMVRVGGTAVLQRSVLPGPILKSLREEKITGLAGMPPVWTLLLQARRSLEKEPLEHLRYLTNSGGMIPKTHLDEMRRLFPSTRIYLMYGLTEAFRATYLPPEEIDRGPACIGRAIPNTDIWIVDENGNEVAPGESGELIQRGPTVALGYWGDPEKTASVYKPNPLAPPETREKDLVVYSGDLVKRGEDGFFYFIGRRDELIKTQGYRVSPGEIEDLLTSIPAVSEAVAFGRPDDMLGQRIEAIVSLNNGTASTEEDIRKAFAEKAPYYMVPKKIHIIPELPKTATGKIDRSVLKNEYARS